MIGGRRARKNMSGVRVMGLKLTRKKKMPVSRPSRIMILDSAKNEVNYNKRMYILTHMWPSKSE